MQASVELTSPRRVSYLDRMQRKLIYFVTVITTTTIGNGGTSWMRTQ